MPDGLFRELDAVPEQAFYMTGSIEEVKEKAAENA